MAKHDRFIAMSAESLTPEKPRNAGAPALALRRARLSDAEAFLRLEQNLGCARIYHPVGSRAEALRELRRTCLYFIRLGGRIAGTVAYRLRNDGSIEISNLALQPEYRRLGLARAAMQYILALHPHAVRFELVTHPENGAALRLYRSLGFRLSGRLENCFGDGEPRLRLVRAGPGAKAKAQRALRANNS